MKDLSFLEFKDTDSPELRGMKAHWQMVMAMPKPERQVFLQEERVKDEERHLQWMIDCNKQDDYNIQEYVRRARSSMIDYKALGEADSLVNAEAWTQLAQSTKEGRYTIADIRKQRERVQWEKKKLTTMQQQSEKQSQSSSS